MPGSRARPPFWQQMLVEKTYLNTQANPYLRRKKFENTLPQPFTRVLLHEQDNVSPQVSSTEEAITTASTEGLETLCVSTGEFHGRSFHHIQHKCLLLLAGVADDWLLFAQNNIKFFN